MGALVGWLVGGWVGGHRQMHRQAVGKLSTDTLLHPNTMNYRKNCPLQAAVKELTSKAQRARAERKSSQLRSVSPETKATYLAHIRLNSTSRAVKKQKKKQDRG
jgi:hypothetical protein